LTELLVKAVKIDAIGGKKLEGFCENPSKLEDRQMATVVEDFNRGACH